MNNFSEFNIIYPIGIRCTIDEILMKMGYKKNVINFWVIKY